MKPTFEKPSKEVTKRMKRIKSRDTSIEREMENALKELGIEYERQPKLVGRPDLKIKNTNVLIFCDSSFWHGRREEEVSGRAFKRNKEFWVNKIVENQKRDRRTNGKLRRNGWSVQRFWDSDMTKKPEKVKRRQVNHSDTKVITKDVREVTGKEILEAMGLKKIDLVAGCPPCQGFSSLTSKYKKDDPRNDLVLEMARIIEELQPEMVMMENVSGITNRGKPILDEFVSRLESLGYVVNMGVLQMADYGVPQSRKRFVLLAGKGFCIEFPKKTNCREGNAKKNLKPWLKLEDIIRDMKKPITVSEAMKNGDPKKYNWHIVGDLQEISIKRLKALEAGKNRTSLPKELRPKCHKKSDKGFSNVYGRLSWDQVPPTITSGFTSPAMGRFGHPDEIRTISVREAAMIQSFPKYYKFETGFIKTACNLIGNALPPKFAEKAAKACLKAYFYERSS